MEAHTPHPPEKPYAIRERLFLFASDVTAMSQTLRTQGPVAIELSVQVVKAAVSAAANAEEADDASSRRDFLAKQRISLRELKETRLRLRVLRRAGYIDSSFDKLIEENTQLVKIVASIIRKVEGAQHS